MQIRGASTPSEAGPRTKFLYISPFGIFFCGQKLLLISPLEFFLCKSCWYFVILNWLWGNVIFKEKLIWGKILVFEGCSLFLILQDYSVHFCWRKKLDSLQFVVSVVCIFFFRFFSFMQVETVVNMSRLTSFNENSTFFVNFPRFARWIPYCVSISIF